MKKNGFTLLEFLIGVTVIFVIVLIALPMHATRAKRSEQADVRTQLKCIRDAQESYRSSHGTYTADATRLANWKQGTKKYHFSIRYADSAGFIAEAKGDLNNDKIYDDRWTIDHNGRLANVK